MNLDTKNMRALLMLGRTKRRTKHSVGRTRIKIAEMIAEQLHYEIDPAEIWMNQTPWAKQMDLERWGCDATRQSDGRRKNIHSWDRMTDILKSKKMAIVMEDQVCIEVCSGD